MLLHVVSRLQLCSRQTMRMCDVLDQIETAAHAAHVLSLLRNCLNKLEFIYTTAYFTYDAHYSYLSWKNKVDALRANKDQSCNAMHLAFVRLRHARQRNKDIEQAARRQASADATRAITAKSVERIAQAAQEVRDAETAYRTFTELYTPLQNFDIELASQSYSDQLQLATEEVHLSQLAYNEYSDYLEQAIKHFPYLQARLEAAVGVGYVPTYDTDDEEARKKLYDKFLTLQTVLQQNAGASYTEKRQWFDQIDEIQAKLLGLVKPDPISKHPEVLEFE